jgi:hypothetical protein
MPKNVVPFGELGLIMMSISAHFLCKQHLQEFCHLLKYATQYMSSGSILLPSQVAICFQNMVYCIEHFYDNGKHSCKCWCYYHVQTLWRVCMLHFLYMLLKTIMRTKSFCRLNIAYLVTCLMLWCSDMVLVLQHIPAWCRPFSLPPIANGERERKKKAQENVKKYKE